MYLQNYALFFYPLTKILVVSISVKALERSIDVVHSKLNTAGLTPEEMQKLQLQLDALKAQHDVALGRLMVETAKKQQI